MLCALKARCPNHWNTREFPEVNLTGDVVFFGWLCFPPGALRDHAVEGTPVNQPKTEKEYFCADLSPISWDLEQPQLCCVK